MDVLLIFNNGGSRDLKVMVRLHTRNLMRKVAKLMEEDRSREAFDLIVSKAQVREYIPPGKKSQTKPRITLIEDLLE